MNGHAFMTAHIELDAEIYPGMNDQHSLISRQFFRCAMDKPFVRHDLRVWESTVGREPRLKGADGRVMLGDQLLAVKRGTARVRAYYDVHPSADSTLTLDAAIRNSFGDALPKIVHRLDAATEARIPATKAHIFETREDLWEQVVRTIGQDILGPAMRTKHVPQDPSLN